VLGELVRNLKFGVDATYTIDIQISKGLSLNKTDWYSIQTYSRYRQQAHTIYHIY